MVKKCSDKLKGWHEIEEGCIVSEAGNSLKYHTGTWRTFKPIWHSNRCIHCMTCWVCCPDNSILTKDGKVIGIDYDHCKGCGVCADVCPVTKAGKKIVIEMVEERTSLNEGKNK